MKVTEQYFPVVLFIEYAVQDGSNFWRKVAKLEFLERGKIQTITPWTGNFNFLEG